MGQSSPSSERPVHTPAMAGVAADSRTHVTAGVASALLAGRLCATRVGAPSNPGGGARRQAWGEPAAQDQPELMIAGEGRQADLR